MSQMSDHKAPDAEPPARAPRRTASGSDSSRRPPELDRDRSAEAAVRAAVDHFNTHRDRRACIDLYHPDLILHGFPHTANGREAILAYFEIVWAAFPDVELKVGDLVTDSERLVMRYEVTGTHEGVFMGISPTGKRVRLTGMMLMRFEQGRCSECWNEVNFLALLQQTGIIPA